VAQDKLILTDFLKRTMTFLVYVKGEEILEQVRYYYLLKKNCCMIII